MRIAAEHLAKATSPPPGGEDLWLEVRPSARRLALVVSYGAMTVAIASCVALVMWVATHAGPSRASLAAHGVVVAPLTILALAILGAAYLRGLSQVRLSLGTDGTCFYLRHSDRRVVASAPIHGTVTNGEYLLIGRRLVPLRYAFMEAFDRDLLAGQIVARLPKSSLVTTATLLWRAIRAGNTGLWALLLLLCLFSGWSYWIHIM
jgi:hypothetical protein